MTLLATAPDRKADFFRNPRVLNQSAIVIGTDLLENNEMEYEDAVKVMTRSLRNKVGHDYGYDVYLPTLIRHHLTSVEKVTWDRTEMPMRELSPVFTLPLGICVGAEFSGRALRGWTPKQLKTEAPVTDIPSPLLG